MYGYSVVYGAVAVAVFAPARSCCMTCWFMFLSVFCCFWYMWWRWNWLLQRERGGGGVTHTHFYYKYHQYNKKDMKKEKGPKQPRREEALLGASSPLRVPGTPSLLVVLFFP